MSDAVFSPTGLSPTPEQLAIQLDRRRHVIVEANAGAAKTTTLALRLAQALVRGAEVDRILVLTYTEAAVTAVKQALQRIGVAAAVRNRLQILTFDAFCAARLLALEGPGVTQFETPEDLKPAVLLAIERVLDNPDERYRDEFAIQGSGEGSVEGLLATFARLKGTLQLMLEAQDQRLTPALAQDLGHDYLTLRVFSRYEHLRRGGHPDRYHFRAPHDATYDLARMLLSEDALLEGQHPLDLGLNLILVDEMHDTNRAMFTVLQHLMRRNPAAFIGVGDRDQVIHAVAGADATFMGETFNREIAPPHRYPLTASYRFGPTLAQSVGLLSQKACVSGLAQDTTVQLLACPDRREAHWHILNTVKDGRTAPAQIAVLLRQPHQSIELEALFLQKGVTYRTLGFETYLMRREILLARGMMAYALDAFADIPSPETRERVLAALLLFTGSQVDTGTDQVLDATQQARLTQQALKEVAAEPALMRVFVDNHVLRNAAKAIRVQWHAAIEVLQSDSIATLQRDFMAALQPQALAARVMVRASDIEEVQANLNSLVQSADQFDTLASLFRGMNTFELHHQRMRGNKDGVLIASIEAAKGLEFEHVMMPGLNRGEFAVGGQSTDNRNLLYVGMTRARQRLSLMFDPARPSKYLKDAGLLV